MKNHYHRGIEPGTFRSLDWHSIDGNYELDEECCYIAKYHVYMTGLHTQLHHRNCLGKTQTLNKSMSKLCWIYTSIAFFICLTQLGLYLCFVGSGSQNTVHHTNPLGNRSLLVQHVICSLTSHYRTGRTYITPVKTIRFAIENILAWSKQSAQINQVRYPQHHARVRTDCVHRMLFIFKAWFQGIFPKFLDVRADLYNLLPALMTYSLHPCLSKHLFVARVAFLRVCASRDPLWTVWTPLVTIWNCPTGPIQISWTLEF